MSVKNDRALLEHLIDKYGIEDVRKFVSHINEDEGAQVNEDGGAADTNGNIPTFKFKDIHIRYKAKNDPNKDQAGKNNSYDVYICDGTQAIFKYEDSREFEGEHGEFDDFVACIGGSPSKDAGVIRSNDGQVSKAIVWEALSQYCNTPWVLGFDAKEVETAVKVFKKFYPKSIFGDPKVWPIKGENPYTDWGKKYGVSKQIIPNANTHEPAWGCNPFWAALKK